MRPAPARRTSHKSQLRANISKLDPLLCLLILASIISIWSGVRDISTASKSTALSGKVPVPTSQVLDIETLAYNAFTKYSFAVHPRAIVHHIKQKHFPKQNLAAINPAKRLLIFFESELPSYADQTLFTLRDNTIFDVLVITTRTQGLCTRFRPDFLDDTANVQVVCMSRTEMDLLSTWGLCTGWACNSHDFTATYRQIRVLPTSFPVRALFGTTFQDQIEPYSGWAWADFSLIHGDYDALFPKSLLELDVLTFPTHPSRHDIHLRKSISIFSKSSAIRQAWLWTPIFKNVTTFVNTMKYSKNNNLDTLDEGGISKIIVRNPEISYAQIPRLLGQETLLGWKTSVTMRGDRHALLTLPEDTSSLDEEAYFQAVVSKAHGTRRTDSDETHTDRNVLPLEFVDFEVAQKPIKLKMGNLTAGNVHMKAIPVADRVACYFYSPELAQDKDGIPAIMRTSQLSTYQDIVGTQPVQEAFGLVGASAERRSGVPLPFQGATEREAREILFYQMRESAKSWPLKGKTLADNQRLRFRSGSVEVAATRPLR